VNTTLTTRRYRIEGMDCPACASKIEAGVVRLPGVSEASASYGSGTLTVRDDGRAELSNDIPKRAADLGYTLVSLAERPADKSSGPAKQANDDEDEHGAGDHHHEALGARWWQSRKAIFTLVCAIALLVAYGLGRLLPDYEKWIFTAAMLIGLVPIARRAVAAAVTGTPFSIEMLMTVAAIGAVLIGASEEAAAVVLLFLIGELLEGVAAGRARASIQSLANLVPTKALVEADGKTEEVAIDSLQLGSIILVRPGDRISADGEVVSGTSAVDQAPVTGESTPVRKSVGDTVFAGTVNGEAALRVKVTATAADNTIARVVKLVEEAQEAKAPTERFIDRFSKFYTPGVVVVAALIAVVPPALFDGSWDAWIYKGLAILLIGCPCALVISTPAAVAASLAAGAKRGLLMKGGAVLESVGKITAAALDKTGTLTAGKPKVTDVVTFQGASEELMRLAAGLERGSSHPLAKAILDYAAENNLEVPELADLGAIGGKGVNGYLDGREIFLGSPSSASEWVQLSPEQLSQIAALNDEGKTVSVLLVDKAPAGAIAMRDEPRPDAKIGLEVLKRAGIKTVMLTGDNARTAQAIGKELNIEVRADLLPQDKQQIVSELQAAGFVVAKVGDGINDAPALAAADVGIAMGGGTDVALETADAAILHGRVIDIAEMVNISKRTMRNIHQNITIALGLKAVFLVTTVVGLTGLWPAILADTGATVLVTINALRLLRVRNTTTLVSLQ
jgi:Cd2+/Zn2+-exporting ATPase